LTALRFKTGEVNIAKNMFVLHLN